MSLLSLASSQRPIKLPSETKERALRWVQTQPTASHRGPADAPFRRMIDFWFAAIAWAVRNGISPVGEAAGPKFVSIGPTPQDVRLQDWKAELLFALAVKEFGYKEPKAQDAAAIVDLANRYAEAGAGPLLARLESGEEFAVPLLYRVTDLLTDEVNKAVGETSRTF